MPQITQIKSNQAKEKRSDFPKTFPGQGRGTQKKKDSPSQQPLRAHPSSQDLGLVFSHFLFFLCAFQLFPIVVVVAFTAITREFRLDTVLDSDSVSQF